MDNNRKVQYKQRAPYNYIDNKEVIIFANASNGKCGEILLHVFILMAVFMYIINDMYNLCILSDS